MLSYMQLGDRIYKIERRRGARECKGVRGVVGVRGSSIQSTLSICTQAGGQELFASLV